MGSKWESTLGKQTEIINLQAIPLRDAHLGSELASSN
jgi:hypothetical protein